MQERTAATYRIVLTYPSILTTSKCVVVLQPWKGIRIPGRFRRDEYRRPSFSAAFRQCRRHERGPRRRRHRVSSAIWVGGVRSTDSLLRRHHGNSDLLYCGVVGLLPASVVVRHYVTRDFFAEKNIFVTAKSFFSSDFTEFRDFTLFIYVLCQGIRNHLNLLSQLIAIKQ